MAAKPLISLFLILSSYVMVGFSENPDLDGLLQEFKSNPDLTEAMGDPAGSMPCLNKLLPCKQFLQDPSTKPDQSCCLPLKQLIDDDVKCLCDVLNDQSILKTLNCTKEDALKLPKACGSNADASICNALPPSSSSGATSPSPPAGKTEPPKSAARENSNFGVSGSVALLIAFIFYQMAA